MEGKGWQAGAKGGRITFCNPGLPDLAPVTSLYLLERAWVLEFQRCSHELNVVTFGKSLNHSELQCSRCKMGMAPPTIAISQPCLSFKSVIP